MPSAPSDISDLQLTPEEAKAARRMQRLSQEQDVAPAVRTWIGSAPDDAARIRRALAARRLGLEQQPEPENWS